MNQIVVIGTSHHNTLGVIRALGRKGLEEQLHLVLIGESDYISCSRYISKDKIIKIQDESSLVNSLVESHLGSFDSLAIVICCSDSSIATLDSSRSLLNERFIIPSATFEFGGIQGLMSKNLQASIAVEVGLHIPPSTILNTDDIDNEGYLDKWDCFPCILKPKNSIQGHKTDIHICHDKESLITDIKASSCSTFILQEFIIKDFEFQLIGCSLKGGKEIVIPGYTRIIRQPDNTNTGFLHFNPINCFDDKNCTLTAVRTFIKKIEYSGLFSVEFLRGKDGVDYFMEMNMRNDGNAICVTDAGMNLPYVWYASNAGQDYYSEITKEVKSLYCMPEFDDIVFVLKRKISLGAWLQDVHKTTSFMEYSKDDKRPFYKKMKHFISFLLEGS